MVMRSKWNPESLDYNCVAAVARYLHYQVTGHLVDPGKDNLDVLCEPDPDRRLFSHDDQMRLEISRAVSLIRGVGLLEVSRHAAGVGSRYPRGHYAVMALALSNGHVVYGRVDDDDSDFAVLFDPQKNIATTMGSLGGGGALAVRFERA